MTDKTEGGRATVRAVKAISLKHGASATQVCKQCGSRMRISRREQHPTRGPKHELQTFVCPACQHVQHRDALSPGAE